MVGIDRLEGDLAGVLHLALRAPPDDLVGDLLVDDRIELALVQADLDGPPQMGVIDLLDLLDPLHELGELLELGPLVVHGAHRAVDGDGLGELLVCVHALDLPAGGVGYRSDRTAPRLALLLRGRGDSRQIAGVGPLGVGVHGPADLDALGLR